MDNHETAIKKPGGVGVTSPQNYPNHVDEGDLPVSQMDLQGQVDTYSKAQAKRQTTIFDLPRQVWLEIYENLDYTTYLNMRQTNSHFLTLIDEYIGIRATFNKHTTTDPDVFEFYTNIAINDVQFEDAKDKEKFSFEKLLAYPRLLTDVSFTGETNLKLVQDIIMNCHSLQLVEMTMDCKIFKDNDESDKMEQKSNPKSVKNKYLLPGVDILSRFPPQVSYLRYVECLKLVPGIHTDDNLRSHLILSILRSTNAENYLKKVIFQCELSEEITLRNVLTITAEVMERHPKLEALFLALLNDEYLLNDREIEDFSYYMDLSNSDEGQEVNTFKKRIVATGHELKIKKMGLAMLNLNMQRIWGDFLKTQHHLVHLSLTVTIEQGTFSQEMFDSFAGTLEQLAIRGKFELPFDFLHIANCRNLKEICLHNLQENGGGGITPKCVNLPFAPCDLESLILFQVVTRTEEIKEVIRKLEKLTTLVVFKCGHAAGETGIGLRCLQEILHKRSLQSVLMVQFICGSTQEAESLAGVLYNMSLDADNQAGPVMRRRHQFHQPVPANEPENLLDLREIEDGGDELLFAIGGNGAGADHAHIGREHNDHNRSVSPPTERPRSRGCHRDPEPGEALILDDESGLEDVPETQEEDNPVVLQSTSQEDLEDIPLSLLEEESIDVDLHNNNAQPEDPRVNDANNAEVFLEAREDNGDAAMNMLQNILEQAMAGDPQQIQRNPNLQNHMNLNRLHVHQEEFDEDVELVLEMGEQELGPVLDLFAAERLAREHNVQVGFILDGVIDIMNEDAVRSKWLCVEDGDGHITYTLKISVEL